MSSSHPCRCRAPLLLRVISSALYSNYRFNGRWLASIGAHLFLSACCLTSSRPSSERKGWRFTWSGPAPECNAMEKMKIDAICFVILEQKLKLNSGFNLTCNYNPWSLRQDGTNVAAEWQTGSDVQWFHCNGKLQAGVYSLRCSQVCLTCEFDEANLICPHSLPIVD